MRILLFFFLCLLIQCSFAESDSEFAAMFVSAARERTQHFVRYSGAYRPIAYPMGDVPNNIGVCTDVLIRAYRKLGIDLQVLVHEDMRENFHLYPKIWGLTKPDTNIDHRRVPNLEVFFSRKGEKLAISHHGEDYKAGDIVSWRLSANQPHIGIVSDKQTSAGVPYIIHNIGWGPREEDRLFAYTITGHFRFETLPAAEEAED